MFLSSAPQLLAGGSAIVGGQAGAFAGSDAVRAMTRDLLRRGSAHQSPVFPAPPAPDSPAGDDGVLPTPTGGPAVPGAGYLSRDRAASALVVTPAYGWAANRPAARIVTDEPSFSPD